MVKLQPVTSSNSYARPQPATSRAGQAGDGVERGEDPLAALLDSRLTPEQRAEALEALVLLPADKLAALKEEGLSLHYLPLNRLFKGLYKRDTSAIFPLRKPKVEINPGADGKRGTILHELGHALDRLELKGLASKLGRLLGLTPSYASERDPELIGLFQDYQARGHAQMASEVLAVVEDPARPEKGVYKTDFAGVYYFYDYEPGSVTFKPHTDPLAGEPREDDMTLATLGGFGMVLGGALAAALSVPVGLIVGAVAALPLGLGIARMRARKKRFEELGTWQRDLGQGLRVERKEGRVRVELPRDLQQVPRAVWSSYALHTQQPWEYYAEGVRASVEERGTLQEQDPGLLGYLARKNL